MMIEACYAVLGLPGPSTAEEIRRAYKRTVLRFHPDRCRDDPHAAQRFRQATEAYATLRNLLTAAAQAAAIGPCERCQRVGRLARGLHGHLLCARCLLGQRRRLLPLPVYRTVRCAAVILLQTSSLAATAWCLRTGSVAGGVLGLAAGVASVAALAICLARVDRIDA